MRWWSSVSLSLHFFICEVITVRSTSPGGCRDGRNLQPCAYKLRLDFNLCYQKTFRSLISTSSCPLSEAPSLGLLVLLVWWRGTLVSCPWYVATAQQKWRTTNSLPVLVGSAPKMQFCSFPELCRGVVGSGSHVLTHAKDLISSTEISITKNFFPKTHAHSRKSQHLPGLAEGLTDFFSARQKKKMCAKLRNR